MVSTASGLWWDYSRPAVLAATLTLPIDSGNLLLSVLTFLVTVAGMSFWNIIAFILHSFKVQEGPTSAINLQHQVSLRNSLGSIGTLWEAVKIHRAWSKKQPPQLLARTCSIVIPAFLVCVGFAAAAIFTSSVANKAYGTVVARVQQDNCGFWHYNNSHVDGYAAESTKRINDKIQARNHVSNFYANTSGSSTARSIFIRPTLPYGINTSAPCPIPASERCIFGHNSAFSMTTAFLNSQGLLGINAKFEDRVSVQVSVTCSPVRTRDIRQVTETANNTFLEFFLGPTPGSSSTYQYNLATERTGVGYLLAPRFAYAQGEADNKPWEPISDFNRTDADVGVYFLSQNAIRYLIPVYDPWFSANGTYTTESAGLTLTLPDFYVNTMVCADQYIMCNPLTSSCTPASGLNRLQESVSTKNTPGFNLAQKAAAGRIVLALVNSNTFSSVAGLGTAALWANNLLALNVSPGLPDNQWQTEVLGWFQTSLAKLQAYVVEFASNTADLGPFGSVLSPHDRSANLSLDEAAYYQALQDQCANQLVQTVGETQNFSFLGVVIIVCVSTSLVLLDCSLERIVDYIGRCSGWESITRTARQADNRLHLLRMALIGPTEDGNNWERGGWDVPVLDGTVRFNRPTISKGLVSYVMSSEPVEDSANGDGNTDILSK